MPSRGLELFRQLRPNIVTLDLMMPSQFNVDSMFLVQTMKREMPKVAVIVVSVIPFEKTRNDFLEEGVLAYVIKPLTPLSFEPVRTKLIEAFPELADAHLNGEGTMDLPGDRYMGVRGRGRLTKRTVDSGHSLGEAAYV
jgi:DNA-binding NarL/FixJ family response regulator